MNKKFKNISPRIQFFMHVTSSKQTEIKKENLDNLKVFGQKFKNMTSLNVLEIDPKVRRKCINLSLDLQDMNSAERLAFMYDDPAFPKTEKILMINTCLSIMEQIEAYEVCATLDRMRKYMRKQGDC
jgi:hypothetical protein